MLHRAIFDTCFRCEHGTGCNERPQIGVPVPHKIPKTKRQKLYNQQVDSYSYEDYTCSQGYRSIGLYQNMQYEFLLDMALEDLLDSNFRGAYFNFAAAEERFYEFVIKLICKDYSVSLDEFENTWKVLGNLTERQYGAYCMLYLSKLGKSPPNKTKIKLCKESVVDLRNKVIHQGYKPTEEETKFYGEYLLKTVFDTLSDLKLSLKEDTMNQVVFDKLQKLSDELREKLNAEKVNLKNISFVTICGGSICSQLFVAKPVYKSIGSCLD
ncbi:MAG: hypothetical protein FWG80_04490 [Alphaproteobacteria bacterium]|nr:hypothetical protein [Alphaproteobacteria bacterium]